MPQETTTIFVCQDCLFVHANGESEGMDKDKVPFSKISPGDSVALGGEHIDFDTHPCEACGDPLAGDRYEMVIFHN